MANTVGVQSSRMNDDNSTNWSSEFGDHNWKGDSHTAGQCPGSGKPWERCQQPFCPGCPGAKGIPGSRWACGPLKLPCWKWPRNADHYLSANPVIQCPVNTCWKHVLCMKPYSNLCRVELKVLLLPSGHKDWGWQRGRSKPQFWQLHWMRLWESYITKVSPRILMFKTSKNGR